MTDNGKEELRKIPLIPPWNEAKGLAKFRTRTRIYCIECTERNNEGRTCFVKYMVANNMVIVTHGVHLDSQKDIEAVHQRNAHLENEPQKNSLPG